jgi:hypothetical protein
MDEEEALKALLAQQERAVEETRQRLAAAKAAKAHIVAPGIHAAAAASGGAALVAVPGSTIRYARVAADAHGTPISRAGRDLALFGKAHRVEAAAAPPSSTVRNHALWSKFYDHQDNKFKSKAAHADRYHELMSARNIPVDRYTEVGRAPRYFDEEAKRVLDEREVYGADKQLVPQYAGRTVADRIVLRDDTLYTVSVVLFSFYAKTAPPPRAAGEKRVNPVTALRAQYLDKDRKYFEDMEGNYHQMWKELSITVPGKVWRSMPAPAAVDWTFGTRAVAPMTWEGSANNLRVFDTRPPVEQPKVWYTQHAEHGVPFLKPQVDAQQQGDKSIFSLLATRTKYSITRTLLDFAEPNDGYITAIAFGNAQPVVKASPWMGIDEPARTDGVARPYSKWLPVAWSSAGSLEQWLKEEPVALYDEAGVLVPANACGYAIVIKQFLVHFSKYRARKPGATLPMLTLGHLYNMFNGDTEDPHGVDMDAQGNTLALTPEEEDYTITLRKLKRFFEDPMVRKNLVVLDGTGKVIKEACVTWPKAPKKGAAAAAAAAAVGGAAATAATAAAEEAEDVISVTTSGSSSSSSKKGAGKYLNDEHGPSTTYIIFEDGHLSLISGSTIITKIKNNSFIHNALVPMQLPVKPPTSNYPLKNTHLVEPPVIWCDSLAALCGINVFIDKGKGKTVWETVRVVLPSSRCDLWELLDFFIIDGNIKPSVRVADGNRLVSLSVIFERNPGEATTVTYCHPATIRPSGNSSEPTDSIDSEACFLRWRQHDDTLIKLLQQRSFLSYYNDNVRKAFMDFPRRPLTIGFSAVANETPVAEHDMCLAYTHQLLNIKCVPVFNVFDDFVAPASPQFKGASSKRLENSFYMVMVVGTILPPDPLALLLDQPFNLVTYDTWQLVKDMPQVRLRGILMPSVVVPLDCSKVIKELWDDPCPDFKRKHKKELVNRHVGCLGKAQNERSSTYYFGNASERDSVYDRLGAVGSHIFDATTELLEKPQYFVTRTYETQLRNGFYPLAHIVYDGQRRSLYSEAVRVTSAPGRRLLGVKTDALFFSPWIEAEAVPKDYGFGAQGTYTVTMVRGKVPSMAPRQIEAKMFELPQPAFSEPIDIADEYDFAGFKAIFDGVIEQRAADSTSCLDCGMLKDAEADKIDCNFVQGKAHRWPDTDTCVKCGDLRQLVEEEDTCAHEWPHTGAVTRVGGSDIIVKGIVPGAGKTYSLLKYCQGNRRALFVAPYNSLCDDLKKCKCAPGAGACTLEQPLCHRAFDAITCHSLFGMLLDLSAEDAKAAGGRKPFDISAIDIIVFEEVYLNPPHMLAKLQEFKLLNTYCGNTPRQFFAAGDPHQNAPIMDIDLCMTTVERKAYYDSIIATMFPRAITLTICKRFKGPNAEQDKATLAEIVSLVLEPDLAKQVPLIEIARKYFKPVGAGGLADVTGIAVCYLRETAAQVNIVRHAQHIKTMDPALLYEDRGRQYYIGQQLVCARFYKPHSVRPNFLFTVAALPAVGAAEPLLTITGSTHGTFTLKLDDARDFFNYFFSHTGHSLQGMTVTGNITIFELTHRCASREWFYTALTRAQSLECITFWDPDIPVLDAADDFDAVFVARAAALIAGYKATDIKDGYAIGEDFIRPDYLLKLYYAGGGRCCHCVMELEVKMGDKMFSADRKNNSLGHVTGNIQLCCRRCNNGAGKAGSDHCA